jgi:hypothetical protein
MSQVRLNVGQVAQPDASGNIVHLVLVANLRNRDIANGPIRSVDAKPPESLELAIDAVVVHSDTAPVTRGETLDSLK